MIDFRETPRFKRLLDAVPALTTHKWVSVSYPGMLGDARLNGCICSECKAGIVRSAIGWHFDPYPENSLLFSEFQTCSEVKMMKALK